MASKDAVKNSYKKLAKKYHPDKNQGDKEAEKKFKEISEAYDTLSDPEKKKSYDSRMSFSFDYNRYGDAFGDSSATSFRHMKKKDPPKGNDLKADVSLTLEEIRDGCEKTMKLNKWNTCTICDGTGARSHRKCVLCGGEGFVRKVNSSSLLGTSSINVVQCNKCRGSGLEIESPCLNCQGSGRIKENCKMVIAIPSLVKEGNFITVEGQGDAGLNGGAYGNLLVEIGEVGHENFSRGEYEPNDLETEIEVSLTDLVLGTVVRVPTLSGHVDMKIPPGSQADTKFKVSGKGLSKKHSLYVNIKLVIPGTLTDEQRDLFEKLKNIENELKFD